MTADEFLRNLPEPIAVVGNGPMIDRGAEIDANASVIRFNNFRTDGFEQHVGRKTDLWVTNCWTDVEPRPWSGKMMTINFGPHWQERIGIWLASHPQMMLPASDWIAAARGSRDALPSTGFVILHRLAQLGKKVDAYGFDGFAGGHYWDDEPEKPIFTTHVADAQALPGLAIAGIKFHGKPMKVCATMIVRNEQRVIRRCLDSLRGLVDCAVIVDTGSTDDTLNIIHQFTGFPIFLHARPWVNFGHNRTEAIDLARPHGDYLLRVDADQTLSGILPPLTQDAYSVTLKHSGLVYRQPVLFRAALPWRYVGATHEYLTCDAPHRIVDCDTMAVTEHADSHRRTTGQKLPGDLASLLEAWKTTPDARTAFYLARTYEEMGEKVKAVEFYKRRFGMVVDAAKPSYEDDHELYLSMYRTGLLRLKDGDGLVYLMKAWQASGRWEPIHLACHWMNSQGLFRSAYALAKEAITTGAKPRGMFVESDVYDYLLKFDLSVAASQVGDLIGAIRICEELLAKELPDAARKTISENLEKIRGKTKMAV